MSKSRQNLNIELAEGAKAQLEAVRAWNGMTQKEMVSRLVNWFCRQDRVLQQVILGQIPEEIAPDVAVLLLQRLAAMPTGEPGQGGGGSSQGVERTGEGDGPQLLAEIHESPAGTSRRRARAGSAAESPGARAARPSSHR